MSTLLWGVFFIGAATAFVLGGSKAVAFYLAAVFMALAFFRRPLVIALTHLASLLGLIKNTIDKMPSTIRLVQAPAADPAAHEYLSALVANGFVAAGDWNIPEIPQIKVSLVVHPQASLLGVVESASAIGAQVNLHTLYTDGRCASVTNSKLPSAKFQRPHTFRKRLPGASPKQLLEQTLAQRPSGIYRTITVEEAPRIYEQLYAEETAFRKQMGG